MNHDKVREKLLRFSKETPILEVPGSICVVGNGSSLLDSGLGKKIDSFDDVVRFNTINLTGYELDVGTKLTIWAGNVWGDTGLKSGQSRNPSMLPKDCRAYVHIPTVKYLEHKTLRKRADRWRGRAKHKNFIARGPVLKSCSTELGIPKMGVKMQPPGRSRNTIFESSTGIKLLHYLIAGCHIPVVHITGFDFFKQVDSSIHYYGDVNTSMGHFPDKERDYVGKYIKAGRIVVL
jgi:hypothetical protein